MGFHNPIYPVYFAFFLFSLAVPFLVSSVIPLPITIPNYTLYQDFANLAKMSEKLSLKWNDFQANILTFIRSIKDDHDFSDVTLASEDGLQMNAHKMILACSSPVFENILKTNKHAHPLIYLRGIKSKDLSSILDFLYYGEANVCCVFNSGAHFSDIW